MSSLVQFDLESRARMSGGSTASHVYSMVLRAMDQRKISGGHLIDLGCGNGAFLQLIQNRFSVSTGVDAVRYQALPPSSRFIQENLNEAIWESLPRNKADVVVAIETIEHLENPRAFMRNAVNLCKPGGWLIATTPNQLSFLSLLTLIVKGRFNAFQDVHYPAHLTALLPVDLLRIGQELQLEDLDLEFGKWGRMPGLAIPFPSMISRAFPQQFSDHLLLIGRKVM
ncbi:MAG: class I SAM-dependent methyltransferase [Verrucomicrobiota bacterium]|nr:class I SAM-dependent methyltransferase [Verrucomicrobiota bacterium]